MSMTILVLLFCILEVLTPLLTQGVKATIDGVGGTYNGTVIALIVSVVASIGACVFYMVTNGISFNAVNLLYIIALIVCNWLGATLGYDKVKQIFKSIDESEV